MTDLVATLYIKTAAVQDYRMHCLIRHLLAGVLIFTAAAGKSQTEEVAAPIECDGSYGQHLQGVCRDGEGNLFWSFTTELVKTDPKGKLIQKVAVADHHGDLCFTDGKVYVAVNLGKFNDPKGNADSWVYVYDAGDLRELSKHAVPEVFHGAGGMDVRNDHFFVVGGLPEGVAENYVYEYDPKFGFVKKHIIKSGWTLLGIQTAAWHDGAWWFGCYGKPAELVKTGPDFQMQGKSKFNGSLGVVGVAPGKFLIATGPKTEAGKHLGILHEARVNEAGSLELIFAKK